MTTAIYRSLRLTIIAAGLVGTVLFLVIFFSGDLGKLKFIDWVIASRGMIVMLIGLLSAIRLSRTNEHIFFSMFLIAFGLNAWISYFTASTIIGSVADAISAGSFIYAMIVYPGSSAAQLYSGYFASNGRKWYSGGVLYLTDTKHYWLFFFPVLAVLEILSASNGWFHSILDVVVIFSGLVYFRISYNVAGKTDRSRLAWVMWGGVVMLGATLITILLGIFFPDAPPSVFDALTVLRAGVISISIIMSVFFAGFLDSSLVLRGTIVYSLIFLAVIFLFSFAEHFILHGLSLMLGVESDFTGAFLAGLLALLVQPVHKKLEHILPKF